MTSPTEVADEFRPRGSTGGLVQRSRALSVSCDALRELRRSGAIASRRASVFQRGAIAAVLGCLIAVYLMRSGGGAEELQVELAAHLQAASSSSIVVESVTERVEESFRDEDDEGLKASIEFLQVFIVFGMAGLAGKLGGFMAFSG